MMCSSVPRGNLYLSSLWPPSPMLSIGVRVIRMQGPTVTIFSGHDVTLFGLLYALRAEVVHGKSPLDPVLYWPYYGMRRSGDGEREGRRTAGLPLSCTRCISNCCMYVVRLHFSVRDHTTEQSNLSLF